MKKDATSESVPVTLWRSGSYRDIGFIIFVGVLVLAAAAGAEYKISGGQWGVPLDDAWIHFQFARNLFHNFELAFNTHQPTPGTTSLLWVILLALVGGPFGKYLLASKLLSAVFYLACGVLVYFLGMIFLKSRGAAVLGGVLTLVAGRFAWSGLSGMEITLFSALTLLCVLLLALGEEGKKVSTLMVGITAGLATMARPEGYLLFLCLLPFTRRSSWKNSALFLAGYLVFALPYPLISYVHIGHFLPNTFFAKSHGILSKPDLWFLLGYGYIVLKDLPLLSLFMPLGVGFVFRSVFSGASNPINNAEAATVLWGVGLVAAYSVIFPRYYHYCRYQIPLLPFHVLWGLRGVLILRDFAYRRVQTISALNSSVVGYGGLCQNFKKHINRWGKIFLIATCFPGTAKRIDQFAWNVSNINDQHVDMARWLDRNIPADALILADDVGAIGFIANRPVLDILGVITPEVNVKSMRAFPQGTRGLFPRASMYSEEVAELIQRKKPDYIVIHLALHGSVIRNYVKLTEIYSNELRINSICSQSQMTAFKVTWPE